MRILAPPGELQIARDAIVFDSGMPDRVDPGAEEHAVAVPLHAVGAGSNRYAP
jgi:hypothetical protein